ncbi:MAG TPA: TlpA disulfide reductase family protein [Acidimicrobiia bacterium]|nr:TlpA disulfide reductase family protein [Acidimicrobiia bacterium]
MVLLAIAAIMVVVVRSDDASSRGAGGTPGCAVRVQAGPTTLGDAAPSFRLPGIDGGCVDLSSFRGRPVVVNFWASYCHPCRREFPLFRRALERHADANLMVIGIVFRDIPSDARAFADEFGATWPLALDDDSDAAGAYGVRPIPQTFFINRDGTVVRRVFGLTTEKALERHLDAIL